jgi:hypothetical protein
LVLAADYRVAGSEVDGDRHGFYLGWVSILPLSHNLDFIETFVVIALAI